MCINVYLPLNILEFLDFQFSLCRYYSKGKLYKKNNYHYITFSNNKLNWKLNTLCILTWCNNKKERNTIKQTRFSDFRGKFSRLAILEMLLFIKLKWDNRWQPVRPWISEMLLSVNWKIKDNNKYQYNRGNLYSN